MIHHLLISLLLLNSFSFVYSYEIQRNCIVLVDHADVDENLGRCGRFYLMSKLQSALAEQAAPILVSSSLLNSFFERRCSFEQMTKNRSTQQYKTLELYNKIEERIGYWSTYYNQASDDVIQNKALVVQRINEEFYFPENKKTVSIDDCQLLLNYQTSFVPHEWKIYKHRGGWHLLIPNNYIKQYPETGFNIAALQEVFAVNDSPAIYFESRDAKPVAGVLHDIFLCHNDKPNTIAQYAWNIVFSGHGGNDYNETVNDDGRVSWSGYPIIAGSTVQELDEILEFFNTQVNTHLFHYATCYGSGKHNLLITQDKQPYNFAIISDCLTDCSSYCKFVTALPTSYKQQLTTEDLVYDSSKNSWYLALQSPYHWGEFFNALAPIDFSNGSIEQLSKILPTITYSVLADISVVCPPGGRNFYPVFSSNVMKIDDRLFVKPDSEKPIEEISLHWANVLLVESAIIKPTIKLDAVERIISIKPGDAIHYFKKIESTQYLDGPNLFWQAEGQRSDKTFLIDECTCPYSPDVSIFKDFAIDNTLMFKNVIVTQQRNYSMRLFFTIQDSAMMIVANKPNELAKSIILETITLSDEATALYNNYYQKLKLNHVLIS